MAFASDKGRQGAAGVSTGGYSIDNSLRFNDDDSAYLSRTPSSAGNRKTWTWSGWLKFGNIKTADYPKVIAWGTGGTELSFYFNGNNLQVYEWSSGAYQFNLVTDAIYRDPSAWYHLVVAFDTTQSTASNRIKIYINGSQVTSFSTETYPSEDFNTLLNSSTVMQLGVQSGAGDYYDGYLAEVHFIDGQALDHTSFGETGTYGEWKPIAVTGMTYGTNGFYLDFKVAGTGTTGAGKDVSGEGNHWSTSGIASTDQMLDSPTNNFCTWNPVSNSAGGLAALSEGNLRYNPNGTSSASGMFGTIGVNSGKWYFEVYRKTAGNGFHTGIAGYSGSTRKNYLVYSGQYYYGDNNTTMGWASPGANGEIISCAFDLDNNKIWFARNNVWKGSGNPSAGSGETDTLTAGLTSVSAYTKHANASYTGDDIHNFGQDSSFSGFKTAQGNADDNGIGDFYYTPPTGYLALCTQNLPEPTVVPSEHFDIALRTGTGSGQTVTTSIPSDIGMVWDKCRNASIHHYVWDVLRGTTYTLNTDTTNGDANMSTVSASFSGSDITFGNNSDIAQSGRTYASWVWRANGAGVSNTDGTITSTVSANVDAGFSIVSWTGNNVAATMGHGLTVAPELVILKGRDFADNWYVWHEALAATEVIRLDITNAKVSSDLFSNTEPTASVFSIKAGYNLTGRDFITYCFHSVEGYSKVGSYTGNGSADGTFVHCGFRPAYVMIKKTDAVGSWHTIDAERIGYNPRNDVLLPNSNSAEQTNYGVQARDILSNGFKMRDPNGGTNASGSTFIFLAFAETPFKYTNAR